MKEPHHNSSAVSQTDVSQTNGSREPQRLAGFDAVRGLAAGAVVVLHASYAYSFLPMPGLVWPVPLSQPSRWAHGLFWGIESFIMPLFWVVSGYFLARSLARQDASAVFRNRTTRLFRPMLTVGLCVLTADLLVWTLGLISTDRATTRQFLRMKFSPEVQADIWGPAHLWYVEYLWLICTAVCGLAWCYQRVASRPLFERIVRRRMSMSRLGGCLAVFALFGLLSAYPQIVLGFQHGWVPAIPKFLHGVLFLSLGLLLFALPETLDGVCRWGGWLAAGAAALCPLLFPQIDTALQTGTTDRFDATLGLVLTAFALLATFGSLGLGLRLLNRPHPLLTRMAAAAFWIYLVHHPLVGLMHIAMHPVAIPAAFKLGLVTATVLGLGLWTHARWVQGTWLGELLDGVDPRDVWRGRRDDRPTILPTPQPQPNRRAA